MNQQQYLRFPQVKAITGLSRSTIFRLERENKFPKRRQLSAHAIGWLSKDVEEWISSRKEVANG